MMVLKDLTPYSRLFNEYTELRLQENRDVRISMVNGNILVNRKTVTSGVSSRTYKHGVWGFASDSQISDMSIEKVVRTSEANALFLDDRERRTGKQLPKAAATVEKDFSTKQPRKSRKEMIGFIQEIDDHIRKSYPKVSSRTISLSLLDMEKSLLTSDASAAYSMTPRSVLGISLGIDNEGGPVGLDNRWAGPGQFEDVFSTPGSLHEGLDLLYEHLRKKVEGVYPEAGIRECILGTELAGILAHEAIGHTTEADIVRGGSIAGEYLNREIASPLITLVDFAHTALGERCPVPLFVDDEGTKAEDVTIIDHGVLKQFMHNKETASYYGVKPTGNARAREFFDEPLVRMRNTAILPGNSKLEDMIASVKNGYYLMRSSNGQADFTSEFMFGVVLGYEIKNGKLGKAIRNSTISGVAFDMLKTVTHISDDMTWVCSGTCGKKQFIPVAMGGPAIKCKVNIGGRV